MARSSNGRNARPPRFICMVEDVGEKFGQGYPKIQAIARRMTDAGGATPPTSSSSPPAEGDKNGSRDR